MSQCKNKNMTHEQHHLIGQRVNLKSETTSQVYPSLREEPFVTTHYEIDDPVMQEQINALGSKVRVWLPGTWGTTDHKMGRINVQIDKDGVITKVYNG